MELGETGLRQSAGKSEHHAAPTELGLQGGSCAYIHGAPNGAFRCAALR